MKVHFGTKIFFLFWVCLLYHPGVDGSAIGQSPPASANTDEASSQDKISQDNTSLTEAPSKPSRSKRILVEKNIVFVERDGVEVSADVYRPNNESVLPMIVLIHGGAWITGDKWNFADHARQLVDEGFVVASINYRLAPKFPYPSQLEDCQDALRWVGQSHQRWNADIDRLGVWGYSAGAQLAAMLALKPEEDTPKIRCCVVGGLPCDLTTIPEDSQLLSAVFGGTRREKPELYREASPSYFVSPNAPPIFQYHGTDDFMVPLQPAVAFHEKLRECGITCRFERIEKSGHLVTFMSQESRKLAIEFLKDHLVHRP